jgi:hypothetical protein
MKFLYLLPALLLFGCTYYTETYAQYEGQQQNWPVSTGAGVDYKEALPVYFGIPPRPYIVLGKIASSTIGGNTLSALAKSAKAKGADAIIFWDSKSNNLGYSSLSNAYVYGGYGYAVGSAITTSVPMTQTLVAAVLIKWKS